METDNFEKMVEEIASKSGRSREEVMERVWKTKEKVGLINLRAAAILVGRELGVTFDFPEVAPRGPMKIGDLLPGMSRVEVVGRVVRVMPPRSFEYQDGRKGLVGSVLLRDETGTVRLVLWGERAKTLSRGEIERGCVLRVRNAYVRQGPEDRVELSLGSTGSVEINPLDVDAGSLPDIRSSVVSLSELRPGQEVDVIGKVVSKVGVRVVGQDGRRMASFIITDGKGVVRVSAWGSAVKEVERLQQDDVVRIENASVREGIFKMPELSVNDRSKIVINPPEGEALRGVSFPIVKIRDVASGMPYVSVAGRVRRKQMPAEVRMSDGTVRRVQSVVIADDTGAIRLTFWGDSVETAERLKIGDVLLVKNAYSKAGISGAPELHVGRDTTVEKNTVEVEEIRPSRVKVAEIEPNMECLEVVGKVVEVSQPRDFQRQDGRAGRVASIKIADESGSVRVSFWDELADRVQGIKVGDVVRLTDVYSVAGMQNGVELRASEMTVLEPNLPGLAVEVATPPVGERKRISELGQPGERVEVRGSILQVLTKRPYFNVCPRCMRTITSEDGRVCSVCGEVEPKPKAVLGFMLDDGSGAVKVVVFGEVAERLTGLRAEELLAGGQLQDAALARILGREVIVRGTVRQDVFSGMLEIRATEVLPAEPVSEAEAALQRIKAMKEKIKVGEK
jgi:replication factor A1